MESLYWGVHGSSSHHKFVTELVVIFVIAHPAKKVLVVLLCVFYFVSGPP